MKNHYLRLAISVLLLSIVPRFVLASDIGNNVKTAREVITLLNAGKFKEVISKFDSTMKEAVPEERLSTLWTSLMKQTGEFQKVIGDTTFNIRGYDVVVVTCKFEKSAQDFRLVFDNEGKIAGLFFAPHRETILQPGKSNIDSSETAVSSNDLEGRWEGKLKTGTSTLRIVFELSVNKEGTLAALLDSPDQGVTGIHVDTAALNGNQIRMVINAAHAMYRGDMKADSEVIVGEWMQGGLTLPLTLKKQTGFPMTSESEIPAVTYVSRNVTFENTKADVALAGTLTLPDSTGVFPAVLLIDGSGPHDRDETILGHKPFLVLADYLTRHGIAVLRYDKRGVGQSTGDYATATTEDFASDALAGVNYLMTLKQVNKKEIGLIGHSEGGAIAPMVAVESHNVAFIVMMAGPGVSGEQILLTQGAMIMKADGASDSAIDINRQVQERLFKVVKTERDSAREARELRTILERGLSKMGIYKSNEKAEEMSVDEQLRFLLSPWMKFFISYNPAPTLEKVKCPVLAIWGTRDLQVPPSVNLPAVRSALLRGGNKHFKVMELKGLNHLFQTANTGSPLEYGKIKEAISRKALDVITRWILKEIGRKS